MLKAKSFLLHVQSVIIYNKRHESSAFTGHPRVSVHRQDGQEAQDSERKDRWRLTHRKHGYERDMRRHYQTLL